VPCTFQVPLEVPIKFVELMTSATGSQVRLLQMHVQRYGEWLAQALPSQRREGEINGQRAATRQYLTVGLMHVLALTVAAGHRQGFACNCLEGSRLLWLRL